MGAASAIRLSVEEYLTLDRDAELKSEYRDGEVLQVEVASLAHGIIGASTAYLLVGRLKGQPCCSFTSVRVRVSPSKFVYPDLAVVCGKVISTDERAETLTNPKLIVEILSPATEGYDYHRKFNLYRQLPSFEEYVLMAQDEMQIEVFRKAPGDRWILSTYKGVAAVAPLESIGIDLPLDEVYAGVEFAAPPM
jgi:Uma2 family endonuclease